MNFRYLFLKEVVCISFSVLVLYVKNIFFVVHSKLVPFLHLSLFKAVMIKDKRNVWKGGGVFVIQKKNMNGEGGGVIDIVL